MKYSNPIISGFHPDPSVCRVGNDFYLVNSSFEYFPGIPIYHSTDLVCWEQIGHCISRNEQIDLFPGNPGWTGTYAPTIRYNNGIFYVICTNIAYTENVPSGNFIVHTTDPFGEWSNPVWLHDCGGIDPSLYFEEDKVYFFGTDYGIYLREINIETGETIKDFGSVWNGTGGTSPEGPHLYKKDDFYYLMLAEGGTEYGHMITIARSDSIEGPYESCPYNPILSNRSKRLNVAATGHGDIFDDTDGNYWAVCLGIRPISYPLRHNLGRETMLVPVKWEKNDWPIMGIDGILPDEIDVPYLDYDEKKLKDHLLTVHSFTDDFSNNSLNMRWNYIYNKNPGLVGYGSSSDELPGLTLYGNYNSLNDSKPIAWLGCRQIDHEFYAVTKLSFDPVDAGDEAGMTIYMNNKHHYESSLTKYCGERCIIFRRQIGTLWKVENVILWPSDTVYIKLDGDKEFYRFSISSDNANYTEIGSGEVSYLTTEVGGAFTGNYIGLYASGNGHSCNKPANFIFFRYN